MLIAAIAMRIAAIRFAEYIPNRPHRKTMTNKTIIAIVASELVVEKIVVVHARL